MSKWKYVSTALENNEEVLKLRQRHQFIVTAYAENDNLYQIVIKPIIISPTSLTDAEEVCLAAWTEGPKFKNLNLPMNIFVDTTIKPKLWHKRLEHRGMMVFRRMLPLITGHNLNTSDVFKTYDSIFCIQGNFIQMTTSY